MQILQRLPWPPNGADEVLLKMYFLLNRPVVWDSISGLSALCPADVISLSTYFGAFSLTTWCDSAGIDKVVIRIKTSGRARIRIIHIKPDERREVLAEKIFPNDLPSDEKWTEIALDNLSGKQGILFPEITVLEEGTRFTGLEYVTPQPPRYPVRMALIMTTFKRESYVKKNMEKILTLLPEYDGRINFIIVDNGKSLNIDPVPPEVTILPNGNFGGSGGFGRGLLEALDDPKTFTHFLFCDDDIEFETETVRRTYSLWQYIDGKTSVVGGAMLSMEKKDTIYAAGEFYDLRQTCIHYSKPAVATLPKNLVDHDLGKHINYFAWWYFSFSRDIYELIGMPLPIFVKGDDIEFGLRLSRIPVKYVTLLGCGVWHEDFSRKMTLHIMEFYTTRNMLIVNTMYKGSYTKTLFHPLNKAINYILSYRYLQAKLVLFSCMEFLKGPEHLMTQFRHAPEFHAQLTDTFQFESVKDSNESYQEYSPQISTPVYLKALMMLTLNGHLLPAFFFERRTSQTVEDFRSFRLKNIFRRRIVIYHDKISGKGFMHRHDKKEFFYLLARTALLIGKTLVVFPFLSKRYQSSLPQMTNELYWREVMNKPGANSNAQTERVSKGTLPSSNTPSSHNSILGHL